MSCCRRTCWRSRWRKSSFPRTGSAGRTWAGGGARARASERQLQLRVLRQQPLAERLLDARQGFLGVARSEEHTSELQSLMRISYAVFCLKKKTNKKIQKNNDQYLQCTAGLSTNNHDE